jgi:hypothetical protein
MMLQYHSTLAYTNMLLVLPGHEGGASWWASAHPLAAARPSETGPDVWWPDTWILTNIDAMVDGRTLDCYQSVDTKQIIHQTKYSMTEPLWFSVEIHIKWES